MLTKDHYILSKALIRYMDKNRNMHRSQKILFTIGSVEPDFNPISYIKWVRPLKPFFGHNYENALPYMKRMVRHLYETEHWMPWDYYRYGRLIHYVADGFTFPHNQSFQGNTTAHHVYEENLHEIMPVLIQNISDKRYAKKDFIQLHKGYEKGCGNLETDSKYIICAVYGTVETLCYKKYLTLEK